MRLNLNHKVALFYILMIICALLILIPYCPFFHLPNRDSGVFLYAGQQILNDSIPYSDFWDHKTPLIFYINAFGLILGAGTNWGVWVTEVGFLLSAVILSFKLLKNAFNLNLAFLGTIFWILSLSKIIQGGN